MGKKNQYFLVFFMIGILGCNQQASQIQDKFFENTNSIITSERTEGGYISPEEDPLIEIGPFPSKPSPSIMITPEEYSSIEEVNRPSGSLSPPSCYLERFKLDIIAKNNSDAVSLIPRIHLGKINLKSIQLSLDMIHKKIEIYQNPITKISSIRFIPDENQSLSHILLFYCLQTMETIESSQVPSAGHNGGQSDCINLASQNLSILDTQFKLCVCTKNGDPLDTRHTQIINKEELHPHFKKGAFLGACEFEMGN